MPAPAPGDLPPSPLAFGIAAILVLGMFYVFYRVARFLFRVFHRVILIAIWPVRRITWAVWSRIRNRRAPPRHPPHLCRRRVAVKGVQGMCRRERYRLHERSLAPYCSEHYAKQRQRRDPSARQFDNDRYSWSEKFHAGPVEGLLGKALAEAAERENTDDTDGFIYMYVTAYDLTEQRIDLDKLEDDDLFFFKVGMTVRSPDQRLREHDSALFPTGSKRGVEGQDVFAVDNARSAESIAHALLAGVRYRRFDQIDAAFEKEWFLSTFRKVNEAMKCAAERVNSRNFAQ